jgi:hypothetical protein
MLRTPCRGCAQIRTKDRICSRRPANGGRPRWPPWLQRAREDSLRRPLAVMLRTPCRGCAQIRTKDRICSRRPANGGRPRLTPVVTARPGRFAPSSRHRNAPHALSRMRTDPHEGPNLFETSGQHRSTPMDPVVTARPGRFELPTPGSVDRCSIQLSYGR